MTWPGGVQLIKQKRKWEIRNDFITPEHTFNLIISSPVSGLRYYTVFWETICDRRGKWCDCNVTCQKKQNSYTQLHWSTLSLLCQQRTWWNPYKHFSFFPSSLFANLHVPEVTSYTTLPLASPSGAQLPKARLRLHPVWKHISMQSVNEWYSEYHFMRMLMALQTKQNLHMAPGKAIARNIFILNKTVNQKLIQFRSKQLNITPSDIKMPCHIEMNIAFSLLQPEQPFCRPLPSSVSLSTTKHKPSPTTHHPPYCHLQPVQYLRSGRAPTQSEGTGGVRCGGGWLPCLSAC